MAKFKYNPVTHGLSGKWADLMIFIQRHGKTFLGKMHATRSGKISPDQEAVRVKFDKAAKYAKAAIKDADTKTLYAQKAEGGVTAYNVAFADYFTPPTVDSIVTDGYAGVIGNRIEVLATDDVKVATVKVSILAANGDVIEEGAAVQEPDTDQWVYTATAANAALPGTKIIAVATDLPGNTTSVEKLL